MSFLATGAVIEPDGADALDRDLAALSDIPAVYLVFAREGAPHLGRTSVLRRRLKRLMAPRHGSSRMLHLREVAARIEYFPVASKLEAALVSYELARHHFPDTYLKVLNLRPPAFIKLILSNRFPRSQVTNRLGASRALYYGPFRTRTGAERYEQAVLDLFQVRRCSEDLEPAFDHPGCIYGEMNRCLRPCQLAVSNGEYHSEVERLEHFFHTQGHSLLIAIGAARDRFSEELEFEQAARQHTRYERVQQVVKLRDELASGMEELNGVAVAPSVREGHVLLLFVREGAWMEPVHFLVAEESGEMVSMDRRLRDLTASLAARKMPARERQEHIAILSRWFYSSWRECEWLGFANYGDMPYRRLVRAISKIASHATAAE